jgi:hypothetical protein
MGLLLVFVLVGGVGYYTYVTAGRLSIRNASLQSQLSQLQAEFASLNQTVLSAGGVQANDNSQIAAIQAVLTADENKLSLLNSEIAGLKAGNVTMAARISQQLQNLTRSLQGLQTTLDSISPPIFLRTFGTALASFVERPDELVYLRLTETGPASGAEAALGAHPFNASLPGNSVTWESIANSVAADKNHWFWPMVLENSPGGTNALEFEDAAGLQEVAVVVNGNRTVVPVFWDPTSVHIFKIVIVTPGKQASFYIDGMLVASISTGIPNSGFLLEGTEVKGVGSLAPGVAMLDVYGGLLGFGTPP